MAVDIISITALVVAIIGALGHFSKEIHLNHCSCFCIDSNCTEKQLEKEIINLDEKISKHKVKLEKIKQSKTPPSTPLDNISRLSITEI